MIAARRGVCGGMLCVVVDAAAWRMGVWGYGVMGVWGYGGMWAAGHYDSITYLRDLSKDVLNNTTSTAAKERAKEAESNKEE